MRPASPLSLSSSVLSLILAAAVLPLIPPPAASSAAAQPAGGRNRAFDPALYEGLDFRFVGPYRGGRSTAVTGVPGKPYTFFMGSTGGGVWKSSNAGQSWQNVSDGGFDVAPVGAVAVAASDRSVVYAGTGSACIRGNVSIGRGIYRSVDGGRSWKRVGLEEAGQIGAIAVHPRDADLVYAAALGNPFGRNPERGVYRSTDGGDSWEKVLFVSDSTGAVDLAMNPENPREVYAAMWRAQRKPWTLVSGAEEGGLFRTTDGGDSWTRLEGGLPTDVVGKIGVTVSPADPDRVWALIEAEPGGGVYRSDDGGRSWKRVNDENKLRQRAWYYSHVVADPVDPNTVYALNTDLYRSTDGGRTFDEIPVPHGDVHDLWIDPGDPEIMAVANDGGVQVTVDGGESWSSMNNQPTAEMYGIAVDNAFPYHVYGAQQDNTTIRLPAWSSGNTVHPKEHWKFVGGCETGPVALHPDRPDVVYAGCYGGVIDRTVVSRDQRRNVLVYPQLQLTQPLGELKYRFQWVSPIEVSPHDPGVVYHASNHVHRTENGGMSWETISPDLTTDTDSLKIVPGGPINHDGTGVETYMTIFSLQVSPHDPGVIWAGTDDGRVHVTRDGGGAWSDVTPPGMPEYGTVDAIHLSRHAPGKAYVTVHKYRLDDWRPYVFRTRDYGGSWTRIADGTTGIPADHPTRVVREDPDREGLLFAGTEFGLFVSFDDGARWQSLQLDLPVTPVTDLRVAHDDLALSTQGRGFWVLDDITPLRQLDDEVADGDAHLFAPRPAHRVNDRGGGGVDAPAGPEPRPGGALLHYRLASPADSVRLEVLDPEGRVAASFASPAPGKKAEGKEGGETDANAAAEGDTIPAGAGMHRAAWDLTYPGPDQPEEVVIWGYTGGLKAPPGQYAVRLVADGDTLERALEVRADPRLDGVGQEDFREQFDLAVAVRDTLDRVWQAVRAIAVARRQLAATKTRARQAASEDGGLTPEQVEPIVALADTLRADLYEVKREFTQVKSESGQDPIRFPPMLDNQYVSLYAYVTGTDSYRYGGAEGRPTEGAYTRFEDLNARWARHGNRLDRLREELDRFNRLVEETGLPAVTAGGP